MPNIEVHSIAEVRDLEMRIRASAARTVDKLRQSAMEPEKLFYGMKFERIGLQPTCDTALNLIEQLNQTFTALVTCAAVRHLMSVHGDCVAGYQLNIGSSSGLDIRSLDSKQVAAEVFAAVTVQNNGKLKRDVASVRRKAEAEGFEHAHVFFHVPGQRFGRRLDLEPKEGGVEVWSLDIPGSSSFDEEMTP